MNTKKYFCEGWKLSGIQTSDAKYRVRGFIEMFRKFEDLLSTLDLPVSDIDLISHCDGVDVLIEFECKNWGAFKVDLEVINSYLKAHLPMKSYDEVITEYSKESKTHYLEYELDLGSFQFEYPSHDYFHLSLWG